MSTQTTVVSPYGPTVATPRPAPLVVPVHPVRGWAAADTPRRVAALAALPVAAVYLLGAALPWLSGPATVVLVLAGPPAFYSLARVLRPYAPGGERTVRHWAAATSTAYSLPGLMMMSLAVDEEGFGLLLALVAALGCVVTVAWGLLAFLARLVRLAYDQR